MKLSNLKILIAVPTYKRAGEVTTVELFDDPVLFVDTKELKEYKKYYPDTKIVEYKGRAGLTPKLNFILKYARENKYDAIFKIDDDFQALCYFADGYTERISDRVRIYQVIERMAIMSKDAGTPLFVTSALPDIRKYSRNEPFSLFGTLKIGAYGLLLDNDLHFDERFIIKQDIDMCLQVLLQYRYLFIENRYSFYFKPTMRTKGGVASYRNKDTEKDAVDLLRHKWGDKSFRLPNSKILSLYTLNIKNPFKN